MTTLRIPAATATARLLSRFSKPRQSRSFLSQSQSRERHFDAYARRHFEHRIVPFTPLQLYRVVANVDEYKNFVPWCVDSTVTNRIDERHMKAELMVGFKMFSEKYTSLITLDKPHSVQVDVPHSNLFDYLINDWSFEEGRDPNTTRLSFFVEFRFQNPFYQQVTDMFFEKVAKKMVCAFEQRAHMVYRRMEHESSLIKY